MIKLEGLTKVFATPNGDITAVDNVTMEVPQGEICVLLGPSGCGKTTTLKMINRIIPPTSGKILINGEDTANLNTVDLRRNIGYVIQQIGLFPNMTIEDNIAIVPKLLGWKADRYKARAKELLDMVALDPNTFLKRFPNELSGGQQQRVGVIRALAADPPVMLMDEPFGAIDPINREIIQDEFLKMQQELKKTIMFVSHDIDEAIKMADRIAIFREGQLAQYATPDYLLAKPIDSFVESFVGEDRTLKRLRLANVEQVMEKAPEACVTLEQTIDDAKQVMQRFDYDKSIAVVDESRKPVGFLSKAVVQTQSGQCADHYTPMSTTTNVSDDLRNVVSTMFKYDTTWLPCVDEQGSFLGYVSQQGITHYLGATYQQHEQDA